MSKTMSVAVLLFVCVSLSTVVSRGDRRVYHGKELNTIGMPIGGIAAGQLYLCGDGTLGCWQIFNGRNFSGHGERNYRYRTPAAPVQQGFAVVIQQDGRLLGRRLNRQDFPRVTFIGEYPMGFVRYQADPLPASIQMTAFSPFVPLAAKDSSHFPHYR